MAGVRRWNAGALKARVEESDPRGEACLVGEVEPGRHSLHPLALLHPPRRSAPLWRELISGYQYPVAPWDDDDWVGTPPEGRYTRDRAKPEHWRRPWPFAFAGLTVLVIILVIILIVR